MLAGLSDTRDLNFSDCHGLSGLTELLLDADHLLDQPRLVLAAQQFVSITCDENTRSFAEWSCGVPDGAGETPGLMLGIAGIGYALLRLLDGAWSCDYRPSSSARFSRPAFFKASRSTYSICAFTERSSSSDQRFMALRMSSLIRSGYAFLAATSVPAPQGLSFSTNYLR